jgi:hypothetical protein
VTASFETPTAVTAVRYEHPRILTIDLPLAVVTQLRADGYNALPGSFGRPYKVKQGDGYVPLVLKASCPAYAEQEIIVIDLTPPGIAEEPEGEKLTSWGELDWWAKASTGIVDPRPRAMRWVHEDSDRILTAGGVFVVFAEPRFQPKIVLAARSELYGSLERTETINADNWSFLSVMTPAYLAIQDEYREEIKVCDGFGIFSAFLRRHHSGATSTATLRAGHALSYSGSGWVFIPLAMTKFKETVSAVLAPRNGAGLVLILPQLADKEAAVIDLIKNVLPEAVPRLFPDHEGGRWVHRDEYEHPSIIEQKAAQLDAQRKANEEVARLDREIDAVREDLAFIHGILTKTGEALVADVKLALEYIGFRQVVDVDETNGAEAKKQEDLQVLDKAPPLLVEIKGLAGMPREADTLQVTKYIVRRMRQWNDGKVQGLSLVNHQRHLPALDRDHKSVFTDPQIQDAVLNGTGLMTTWDLFRLLRGKVRWGWPATAVCELLYRTGRIPLYPTHYEPVGKVAKYWPDVAVVSIDIEGERPLRVGDRLGFLLPGGFHEEQIVSLQLENRVVPAGLPGQRVGHKTELSKADVPVGMQVFHVSC